MALGSIDDIEPWGACFGAIRDNVRDFCRLWLVDSNLGDRGCREDREFLPNGIFDIDICLRNDGRRLLVGEGITTPSKLA